MQTARMATAESRWLAAYVLGAAFARRDDDAAVRDILAVTSDRQLIARSRDVVHGQAGYDPATRGRALRLIDAILSDRPADEWAS